jgi:hypothetical protein
MVSRNKALYFAVPVCILLGAWAIGAEIYRHGMSGAVIVGLAGGACCAVAMIALVATRWNRTWSAAERRKSREAYARVQSVYVPLGLVSAAGVAAIGLLVGGGRRQLGTALMVGVGVVFITAAILTAIIVVNRRGPLYDDGADTPSARPGRARAHRG